MKLLNLLFAIVSAGNFGQRRRFQGFHAREQIGNFFVETESEMTGRDINQDDIDPKLQKLIETMITDRKIPSIRNYHVWNLYKKNLNP